MCGKRAGCIIAFARYRDLSATRFPGRLDPCRGVSDHQEAPASDQIVIDAPTRISGARLEKGFK
jgi:hypothetical protein